MKDPVIQAIEKERRALHARLAALDEMERKARRAPRPNGLLVQPHAPDGALRKAQLAALRGAGKITSADLKKRVLDAGYGHHINSQYWTKVLRSLVHERRVAKVPNGSFSTYALKRHT